MFQKLLCVLGSLALSALAAPPLGTVSSGSSFRLNETEVAPTAAASVPFQLGDRLSAADAPAVLRIDDFHAVITLRPHSSLESGTLQDVPFIRLVAGSLDYSRTAGSQIVIFKQHAPVSSGSTKGTIAIASHRGRTAVIAAGAGAAVAGTTVGLATRSRLCPDGTPKDHDCGKNK